MTDRHETLTRLAVRLWTAAEAIDAIRGSDRAWRWTHRQMARLTRAGRQENPEAVRELVHVVEERLEMERDRRQEVDG